MRADGAEGVVYDIPVDAVPLYRGRRVIVRAGSAAAGVTACRSVPDAELACLQLDGLPRDVDALDDWPEGRPIQLTMDAPAVEFPALYRYAPLVDTHPVRVVMPTPPGFARAVKLATSLQMAVKLDVTQPPPAEVDELAGVLDFYLHEASCTQPVEFFHGALRALYFDDPVTLWQIQDADPRSVRRVDADGMETLARPDTTAPSGDLGTFVVRLRQALLAEAGECATCEFWTLCGGYFKWPRRDYDCGGVKSLFRTLAMAAAELRSDVESAGGTPHAP
jgi:hypothetical protein